MNEIYGVITTIPYFTSGAFLGIEAADGGRYRVAESRIANAPCGHRCLARVGDEVTFTLNDGKVEEVRFVEWPECQIDDDEISIVHNINKNLIWGQRIKPNCRCPILIGMTYHHPELDVGMVVHHNIGKYNNKPIALNVRVHWSEPYAIPDLGDKEDVYATAGT